VIWVGRKISRIEWDTYSDEKKAKHCVRIERYNPAPAGRYILQGIQAGAFQA
jgi:hypothetical protein